MIENPSNLTQQLLNLVERVAVEIRAIYNKLQTAVFKVNGQIPDSEGNIQIDAVTKATQDGNGNVISNTYVKKTDKVTSASSADSATKATQDASGNVITSTYATKTELSGKANSSHTHAISDVTNLQSSLNAKLATSTYNTDKATFATKSELNAIDVGVTSFNGSKGAVTYTAPVTSVNGQTGDVTIEVSGGDGLKGNKITAAMPISAGDIVVYGAYIRDLEMEDMLEGYMPLKDCHIFYLSCPILVATSNIASGETSDAVSQFGKFSVANILESPLTVELPVFVRCCFAGEQCLTPNGASLMLEIFGAAYPGLEDVTYEATDLLVQHALSPYPEVEMLVGGLNGYVLLGTASSESEVVLSPSHLVFLDSQFNGTMFTYSEVARYDGNGKEISATYASKSEVSSTYATKEELKNVGGGYTLPAATSTTLGGVKIGSNITNSSGTISLTKSDVTTALGYTPVAVSGSRGSLAGYETNGTSTTINASAPDSNQTGSAITVSNGTSGTSWTKIVRVTAAVTVTLDTSWIWQGGSAPVIEKNGVLVCCWCGSGGIATFVSPS